MKKALTSFLAFLVAFMSLACPVLAEGEESALTPTLEGTVEEGVPETIPEEVVPTSVTEEIVPETIPEEVVPTSVTEEIVPETITEEAVPTSISEEIAPAQVSEDIVPATDPESIETPEAQPEPAISEPSAEVSEIPEIPEISTSKNLQYSTLMREVRDSKTSGTVRQPEEIVADLNAFIEQEKVRLTELGVSEEKQNIYYQLLEKQITAVQNPNSDFTKNSIGVLNNLENLLSEPSTAVQGQRMNIRTLEKPSQFRFNNNETTINSIELSEDVLEYDSFADEISSFIFETAFADDGNSEYLPVIGDIKPDSEVEIDNSVKSLAEDLDKNPVKIVNYVQNNIDYEPYFGAKKGSIGCLRERVCNDVDTASLTIALMRAAEIPARYKNGFAIMTVDQLKDLLGVDEMKTVAFAFFNNKIPFFTVSGNGVGQNIDDFDFSTETHFAVQWTFAEIFYDYDERGGNIDNDLNLSKIETTNDLHGILSDYPKKQWIPVDTAIKQYTQTENEIVHDTASFDTEDFWYDFFQYQGELSPMDKYIQDLQSETGKNIADEMYQSKKTLVERQFEILPSELPYDFASGQTADGQIFNIETWTNLPDSMRFKVRISVLREDDKSQILSHIFFGNEINNQGVDLTYEGATESDKAVIDSYGGIHATPSALVDIFPYFSIGYNKYTALSGTKIGKSLILQFEYLVNDEVLYADQKFSVAGNAEGIYIALSKVIEKPFLDTDSKILLEGNTGLAWAYVKKVEERADLLKGALDHEYDFCFLRAVVTQNRALGEVDDFPTTFDFSGLTIDASSSMTNYSNRGNYKDHWADFLLLLTDEGSYYEGQLFDDVAGLTGVSTVKGLQYAYNNPQTYTVHTINSVNESVIDTLSLSANTKANMHFEVQSGGTVITPDKAVTDGAFSGVLYVVSHLESDGDSRVSYFIGEQVANGGWTTDVVIIDIACDEGCPETYQSSGGYERFIYQDKEVDSISCRISEDDFYAITNNVNVPANHEAWQLWGPGYGPPCFKGAKNFDGFNHVFVVATDGAKFYGYEDGEENAAKYDYWVARDIAKMTIEETVSDFNINKFKFNPIAGTYSYTPGSEAVYYQPNDPSIIPPPPDNPEGMVWIQDNGVARKVTGDILKKLEEEHYYPKGEENGCEYGDSYCGKGNFVLNKLGYPIGEAVEGVQSGFGTQGDYQNFIGGAIYSITNGNDDLSGESFYVPLSLWKYYNDHGTVTGKFGFPVDDPVKHSELASYVTLSQDFEGTRISVNGAYVGGGQLQYDQTSATHSPVWYKKYDYPIAINPLVYDIHFLIVELYPELKNRACFKHYIGLADGIKIGDKNTDGTLKKDYKERDIEEVLTSKVESVVTNRQLNGYEPIGAINGDFFDDKGLKDINLSLGYDYSGTRNWSIMAIAEDNDVEFIKRDSTKDTVDKMKQRLKEKGEKFLYNVIGGGPLIIEDGQFTETPCETALGSGNHWYLPDDPCYVFHDQRTIVGVTENNEYMIILVATNGPWEELNAMMNVFSQNYGEIYYANMFDGGGSPLMMFENDIKRKDDPISPLLLIYSDKACKN